MVVKLENVQNKPACYLLYFLTEHYQQAVHSAMAQSYKFKPLLKDKKYIILTFIFYV